VQHNALKVITYCKKACWHYASACSNAACDPPGVAELFCHASSPQQPYLQHTGADSAYLSVGAEV